MNGTTAIKTPTPAKEKTYRIEVALCSGRGGKWDSRVLLAVEVISTSRKEAKMKAEKLIADGLPVLCELSGYSMVSVKIR